MKAIFKASVILLFNLKGALLGLGLILQIKKPKIRKMKEVYEIK
jgi:hypothetical protein